MTSERSDREPEIPNAHVYHRLPEGDSISSSSLRPSADLIPRWKHLLETELLYVLYVMFSAREQ